MKVKIIGVRDAIGTVMSHDLTLIDSESGYKGARFKVAVQRGGDSPLHRRHELDADDVTPSAIKDAATEVIFRGVPVLPGSNLMLAVNVDAASGGRRILLGVPACAVHSEFTVLDTIMHRVYAGLLPTKDEVRKWGVGGLCRKCAACNYPTCRFGCR